MDLAVRIRMELLQRGDDRKKYNRTPKHSDCVMTKHHDFLKSDLSLGLSHESFHETANGFHYNLNQNLNFRILLTYRYPSKAILQLQNIY